MRYAPYTTNAFARENSFIGMEPEACPPPTFADVRDRLPQPLWRGHQSAIDCYWKTWELAFGNLLTPTVENRFVANFIDTAFNGCLFMWDSAFITMFCRYAGRVFNFQRTLDNFYCRQHADGYICREIEIDGGEEKWEQYDPSSTGPNIMPWSEWDYYCNTGDKGRLARVFPALVAYHQWLRCHRTWQDGTYWGSSLATGMDNQPRVPLDVVPDQPCGGVSHQHGYMSWVDLTLQQILSCRLHLKMAAVLGREKEVADFQKELDNLLRIVNGTMWDEETGFYYDRLREGRTNGAKSIGAFWALLADVLPADKLPRFVDHLRNLAEFNRPHRVPTISADTPQYSPTGSYWIGGVWPPTNYMVVRGLTHVGEHDLAREIAVNHHENVVKVFEKTGTVWENYAPEEAAPGTPSKPDNVGWSGLGPVAVLFEYIFGLRPNAPANELVWDVRLLEEHGVERYPFGENGELALHCAERSSPAEKPRVEVRGNVPVTIHLRWGSGSEILEIP